MSDNEISSNETNNVEYGNNLGKIKWFSSSRGFGFITNVDDKSDVFVHHSALNTSEECWKCLFEGEYVSYSVKKDDKDQNQATNVTGVHGGPLLCETRNKQQNQGPPRNNGPSRRFGQYGGGYRPRRYQQRNKRRDDRNKKDDANNEEDE